MKMRLADLETTPIKRSRSLIQGDPAAPRILNIALDEPLVKFHELAQRRKWGISLRGPDGRAYFLAIICFADNYWLLATSPGELRQMITTWLDCLMGCGWHTP